jgi:hypothetical protein
MWNAAIKKRSRAGEEVSMSNAATSSKIFICSVTFRSINKKNPSCEGVNIKYI